MFSSGTGLERTASARMGHRAYHDADGSVRFLLGNGTAVRLTQRQWERARFAHGEALAPANRGLKWGLILSIPMMIATLAATNLFNIGKSIDALGQWASIGSLFVILCWWPLLMLLLHWRAVCKAQRELDEDLACFPAAPVPPGQPRILQTFEIVASILFGPPVVIDIVGTVWPHAFDGTPLMGQQLGLFSTVGVIAFAVVVIVPRLRHWRRRQAAS